MSTEISSDTIWNPIIRRYVYSKLWFSSTVTGLDRPWGFQEVEVPRFPDIRHMKVVGFSALDTGRLYYAEKIPSTHFC